MKITFICKDRGGYPFGTYGLWTSATMVSDYLSTVNGITTSIHRAHDANDIDRIVYNENPNAVIIEAIWVTPEKLKELMSLKHHSKRTWIVRLHSRWPFLAHEGVAVQWLEEYRKLQRHYPLYVGYNAKDMSHDSATKLDITSLYLPNIYFPKTNMKQYSYYENKIIHIGCFGAIRPLKNQFIQALAAISFANKINKKLCFHMNVSRIEQKADPILKNIISLFDMKINHEHCLIKHEWVSYLEFIQLVEQMDLGLQVSYSETFNIVTADFIWNGRPIIVSPIIDWMPKYQQVDPNNVESIVDGLSYIWAHGRIATRCAQRNLSKNILQAQSAWIKCFKYTGEH